MNANANYRPARPRREWERYFRVFSPRRLKAGYLAVKSRCGQDKAFKRLCLAAVLTNCLLTVACIPLGLLSAWFSLLYVMPRHIMEE